jgi:hypothetical protein
VALVEARIRENNFLCPENEIIIFCMFVNICLLYERLNSILFVKNKKVFVQVDKYAHSIFVYNFYMIFSVGESWASPGG